MNHSHRCSLHFVCFTTFILSLTGSLSAQTWNYNGNANWSETARWTPNTVPNAAGTTVTINANISGTRTITLDIDPTIGTLILGDSNNTNAYIITSGTLTFDNLGAGALLNHNSATPGINPSNSDRIESNVTIADVLGMTIDADRNIEFRGSWNGNGTNSLTLTNSGRAYWNNNTGSGTLSNLGTLNILNGEARFDGVSGTPGSNLIGAATINLGDGFATSGGSGFRVFPRLSLINTETTQTATLNVNGGWLVSDLGSTDNLEIWSGNINFTGAATTNIFDVNDAGAADTHIVSGIIGGTGGFSKVNAGTLELTANNNLQGNIFIQRGGVGGANISSEGGIRLTGTDGAFSAISSMTISRDGSIYLDNSLSNNSDRFHDSADLFLRGEGRLRLIGNAGASTSEVFGALTQETGSGKINFDLDDTTPQGATITFSSYTRAAGSITQFQVLENTPGAFGSYTSGNAQVIITDGGATSLIKGGGGANGATNKSLVVGAYGGVNNVSNHFMTFDSANPTELRPLKWDGTQVGSEYFLTRDSLIPTHTITVAGLGTLDQNVLINYNVGIDGDVDWYGIDPVNIQENLAMNSLRFGTETPTSSTNATNSNELGSTLVLSPGTRVYLGDSLAANTGLSGDTDGSGMILFGRAVDGTSPGSNQFIAGGFLDFGSREAILVNESGNSAYIRSNITGTGGLTKAGANSLYLDNSNSYSGETNIAEGNLILRDANALGDSSRVNIEGSGRLYLELGTNVVNPATGPNPPELFVGVISATNPILYSNDSNNTWGGNIIIDTVDNLGNWVFTPRISVNAFDTLNINGNIFSNEEGVPSSGIAANPINTDVTLNDARMVSTYGGSGSGGVINLNGVFQDNVNGPIATAVSSDNENQVLRFQVGGSNELVVNVRNQWNAAGMVWVEQGLLRYEGDGDFWSPAAAAVINAANGQSGLRLSGNTNGSNNSTANNGFILTKAGQNLNISRIDIGGYDGTNNANARGNVMLAGTNSEGIVTFGDGTDRIIFGTSNANNAHVRDLTTYQAAGGTMDLNFRLDDNDGDVHTSFTKIGRGVVNYNGQTGTTNGDVEQLNMSGGLLRLTNYGNATGSRFDNGAMITLAGGGIEMDTVGAVGAETANYTGAAVAATAAFPTAQTLITAGGTDVIVTSGAFNATMNIGSAAIPLTRQTGGTVNFVENKTGAGNAAISLLGIGAPADGTAIAWATYGDTYFYNAAAANYTLNALDFAMTTSGALDAFSGSTREENDDASTWTNGNDVSENGIGFSGTTGVGASVNTIHFDSDSAGSVTVDAGGLTVDSGGIMVSSAVTSDTSLKSILGGPISAGGTNDLIVHHYGASPFTIGSVIQDTGGNSLVKTGSGTLVLTGLNTYTGKTHLNGGTLSIAEDANLGTAPVSPVSDGIYINGGNLMTTADFTLDANRGITLGGNGGELNIIDGTTLSYGGLIQSEPNLIANYTANPAVGRLDKTGLGTLEITSTNNSYNGLTEIREGTLIWAPGPIASATVTPFGSNSAFLDGTIVRSGATLKFAPLTTASNQSFNTFEWFTFEGGSTLDMTVDSSHEFNLNLRGVLNFDSLGNLGTPDGFQTPGSLAGATIVNRQGGRTLNFNDGGGYITGDGGITKVGSGVLAFRENNPEWTGQLIVSEGQVEVYSAGTPLGVGTLPIILGHNLFAEQAGEYVTGNGTVTLTVRDEGGYRDTSTVSQDIIVRADDGAGTQTKRIGARYLAEADVVNYNGSLTLRDDLQFFYQDDARDSTNQTSTANTRNDTRAYGALNNSETVYINFNGNILGSVGNDITTVVNQSGNGNVINGSITGAGDDLVVRAIFGLNGDNSGWAGNLIMGNTTSDVDTQHIVSIGNSLGISALNSVTLRNNSTLQTSGNHVIMGSLLDSGTTQDNFIENASTTAGSITITQTVDATVEIVIRDGVNFFQLQPGEVDAALSLVKAGPSRLTLTKGNTFSGTTTLSGGTLQLAYSADSSMLSDTALLILNDGILDLAGTVTHSETVLGTVINGTTAIERSTGTSIINLNTISRNAGSLRISEDNIATTDNLNINGILGGWVTVGGNFATNSTNGPDGLIVGLTTFEQEVNRLGPGNTIADGATQNVRIIEAGTSGSITLASTGTTTINTLLQSADGSTGATSAAVIDIDAGKTLRIAAGGVLLPDGSSALTFAGSGTLTAGSTDNVDGTLFLQSQDSDTSLLTAQLLTVGAVIGNNGSGVVDVRTTGPGYTVFIGENTYTGQTLVGSGTLALGDGGTSGTLGNSGSGGAEIEASGALVFNRSDTLILSGAVTGTGTIAQFGAGTTLLNATAAQSGLSFLIVNGTLSAGADNSINTTSFLTYGDTNGATATGSLNLTNGSATIGGMLVQTDSTTENQLLIGAGKTLTVNGGVTIGSDLASSDTKLTVTGSGTWNVNQPSGTFQVGGASDNNTNRATLDMSGLSVFVADLGSAGVFRVGDDANSSGGGGSSASTVTLADTSTITAGLLGIGDRKGSSGGLATLKLGSVSNTINADRISIGDTNGGDRGSGVLQFDTPTGTVAIRGSSGGTSRSNMDVANSGSGTGATLTGVADFTGHDSDVMLDILSIGNRSAGAGSGTGTFSFDTGNLDVTAVRLGQKTGGSGTNTISGTINLSGGSTSIGLIEMGVNRSAANTNVNADINIAGGTVTIGTGSGTAINMADANTGRTVNSTMDLTGGATTVTGNIIRSGSGGTENATITLNGGTLNMSGNRIGTATEDITLVAASGTLGNLGELNGGGTLEKTTAGTLVLEGSNTYTGTTRVSAGILSVSSEENLGSSSTPNAAQLEINGGTLLTTADFTIDDANRGITIGASGGTIRTATGTTLTIASPNVITTTGNFVKDGDGALMVNSIGTGSGTTTISAGTLGGTGTISGNTIVASGAFLSAGDPAVSGGVGTLSFSSDLTTASTSTWLVDLVQGVAGTADLIDVGSNALDISGANLTINFSGVFQEYETYTIATFGSLSGTFASLSDGAFVDAGMMYQINYGTVTPGAITLTAVPEPGTLGFLGLTIGGFFFRRLRKRCSRFSEEK